MKKIRIIQFKTSSRMRQLGFSLIELMVAVVIGLFIILGLSQMFLSMYSTSQTQTVLAQFQENERIAIVMLTNTVQQAGYFYNPTAQSQISSYTTANADTSVFTDGAGITGFGPGTGTTPATSDSIDIYYTSSGSDNIFNCQGGLAAAATPTSFINSFSINSSGQLQCTVTTIVAGVATGPSKPLILASGIQSMTILYGVDLLKNGTTSSYLPANSVTTSATWIQVRTAQITINFFTPNVINPAVALTTTTPWIQTINIMRQS